MPVDPTLTISIDRTGLALGPLVLSGTVDGTMWGLSAYTPPAMQARITYAGDSPWLHGSIAVSAVWQQTMLAFDAFPAATTETDVQSALAELSAAVAQLTYSVTVTIDGSPAVEWRADWGSVTLANRQYEDLVETNPMCSVSIPVFPIPVP